MGYFYGIELVKDPVTRGTFDDEESERAPCVAFSTPRLFEEGLIRRAGDAMREKRR